MCSPSFRFALTNPIDRSYALLSRLRTGKYLTMIRHFAPQVADVDPEAEDAVEQLMNSLAQHVGQNARNADMRRLLEFCIINLLEDLTKTYGAEVASKSLYEQLRCVASKKRQALRGAELRMFKRIFNRNGIQVQGPQGLEATWLNNNPEYRVQAGVEVPRRAPYTPPPGLFSSLVNHLERVTPTLPQMSLDFIRRGVTNLLRDVKWAFNQGPGGQGTPQNRRWHVWGLLIAEELNMRDAPGAVGRGFAPQGPNP